MSYAFYNINPGYLKIGYEKETVNEIIYINQQFPHVEHKFDHQQQMLNHVYQSYQSKENSSSLIQNTPTSFTDMIYSQFAEYFAGRRKEFDFPYHLKGTPFQMKVWNALLTIPYGETRNYQDIAIAIGNPKACQAVGQAVHNNPIWIAIPCHRVVGKNGSLTGYAGGLELKEFLLNLEQAHIE